MKSAMVCGTRTSSPWGFRPAPKISLRVGGKYLREDGKPCILRREDRTICGIDRDRPIDGERWIHRVDRHPGHTGRPLGVEAVQVLSNPLADRLEAVADALGNEHLRTLAKLHR